jgi:hypothetical protein
MRFKNWLAEVAQNGGLAPDLEKPPTGGSMADYHGKEQTDPANPYGNLPPAPQKNKTIKGRYSNGKKYKSGNN